MNDPGAHTAAQPTSSRDAYLRAVLGPKMSQRMNPSTGNTMTTTVPTALFAVPAGAYRPLHQTVTMTRRSCGLIRCSQR